MAEKIDLSEEDWKKQHDEISKSLNNLVLVLIGFCFFCAVALGAPDRSLLAADAKIKLPFANTEISFISFLLIGPLMLIALSVYLHIFVGYWLQLTRARPGRSDIERLHPELPFVFNLRFRTATWFSTFLFYWLVPIMLGVFTWKALSRPEGPFLLVLTSSFALVFLFLGIRRRPTRSPILVAVLLWFTFFCSASVTALTSYYWDKNYRLLSRQLNLRKADLTNLDLKFLDLSGANLTDANLTGANLMGTDLSGADLTGAILTNATLGPIVSPKPNLTKIGKMIAMVFLIAIKVGASARLAGADLTGVQGLTQTQVDGAYVDEMTTLPEGIKEPLLMPQWPKIRWWHGISVNLPPPAGAVTYLRNPQTGLKSEVLPPKPRSLACAEVEHTGSSDLHAT